MNSIAELFEIMRVREQLQSMRDAIQTLVLQDVDSARPYLANKDFLETCDTFTKKAMNIITMEEIMEDMKDSYQRHFSEDDIEAFIAFYGSPAGQHFLDAQPTIVQEYQPVIMGRVKVRTEALKKEIDAFYDAQEETNWGKN